MSFSAIKRAVLRFSLTALMFLLLVLLSAAVEGTIALPLAIGLGLADALGMNILCGLLNRPGKATHTCRQTAAPSGCHPAVQLRVVSGGRVA